MQTKERLIIRQNIAQTTHRFHHEGYQALVHDPLDTEVHPGSREAQELWNVNKPERNALIAILSDRVVDRGLALRTEFPPFGLAQPGFFRTPIQPITEFSPKKPFLTVRYGMRETLRIAKHNELRDLERILRDKRSTDPIKDVYQRYKKIAQFGQRNIQTPFPINANTIIEAGIGTATAIMTALADITPVVVKRARPDNPPTHQLLSTILENSYPLIADLAASHVYILSARQQHLGTGGKHPGDKPYAFSPEFFMLTDDESPRIVVTKEINAKLQALTTLPKDYKESELATGCPALIRFGERSAVQNVWQWTLDVAKEVYRQQQLAENLRTKVFFLPVE
jgi:hypothetical protein